MQQFGVKQVVGGLVWCVAKIAVEALAFSGKLQRLAQSVHCLIRTGSEIILRDDQASVALLFDVVESSNPVVQPVIRLLWIDLAGIERVERDGPVQQAKFEMPDVQHIAANEIIFSLKVKKVFVLAQQ